MGGYRPRAEASLSPELAGQAEVQVQAQRDGIAAAFQALAATGQLRARQLAMPAEQYGFAPDHRTLRDK